MDNFNKILYVLMILTVLVVATGLVKASETCLDWERILQENRENLEQEPGSIMDKYRVAIALANLGQVKECYHFIDEIDENISDKQFEKAVSPHLKELKDKPEDILLLNYAAFSGLILDDYRMGIDSFKTIIELCPENVWPRNFLGATYIEAEMFDRGQSVIKKGREIQETDFSYLLMAVIHYEKGNILKALGALSRSGDLAAEVLKNR